MAVKRARSRSRGPSTPAAVGTIYADLSAAPPLALERSVAPWRSRHEQGKALRRTTPRRGHARWHPSPDRPDPLERIAQSNEGRVPELVPLRMGRMAASRFGFLRGSACVMAPDLARTPVTGVHVLIDGDAHLDNFGLFGTVERDVVFDLNDFDESVVGPWEWDVKRLATSVEVAGRDLGLSSKQRTAALRFCLRGYHDEVRRLERRGALDIWYMFLFAGRRSAGVRLEPQTRSIVRDAAERADRRTNATLLEQVAERTPTGGWRLRDMPPIQTRVSPTTRRQIVAALSEYADSLSRDRRFLFGRYHVVDVARHVIGVGSVGTRVYIALLFGNGEDDPLFLQLKEGTVPAATPFVPPLAPEFEAHQGRRVVVAQMGLNSSPDILLGWTRIDGRPFYVRQMRNLKGAVPLDRLGATNFPRYAELCGTVLGRAHARSGDAALIAGYWGESRALEEAFAAFARAYADQVERDRGRLLNAIRRGRVQILRET